MASDNKILSLLLTDVAVEIPIDICLSSFNFDLFIRGHHVYRHIWTAVVGEDYCCIRKMKNKQNKNTIAVVHEEIVVGRIPMTMSMADCTTGLRNAQLEAKTGGLGFETIVFILFISHSLTWIDFLVNITN